MLNQKVKHEVGLAAVVGAFVAAMAVAGVPALHASVVAVPMEYANSLPNAVVVDVDRDGIPDDVDGHYGWAYKASASKDTEGDS